MKVGQQTFVRWMSKLVAKSTSEARRKQGSSGLRSIDIDTLRHVGGGSESSTQSPNKGW
jgi:hypothetical protein